jgi:hypothetical protein
MVYAFHVRASRKRLALFWHAWILTSCANKRLIRCQQQVVDRIRRTMHKTVIAAWHGWMVACNNRSTATQKLLRTLYLEYAFSTWSRVSGMPELEKLPNIRDAMVRHPVTSLVHGAGMRRGILRTNLRTWFACTKRAARHRRVMQACVRKQCHTAAERAFLVWKLSAHIRRHERHAQLASTDRDGRLRAEQDTACALAARHVLEDMISSQKDHLQRRHCERVKALLTSRPGAFLSGALAWESSNTQFPARCSHWCVHQEDSFLLTF